MICLALIGGLGEHLEAAGFELQAGLGYDFLSQQYFLDSAAVAGVDSIFTQWALESTYLDDVKGMVAATIRPLDDYSLEFRPSLEQTKDYLRLKMAGNWRYRADRRRLDVDGEIEWKNRFDNDGEFGDDYLYGYGRTKLALPAGENSHIISQVRVEGVDFQTAGNGGFDYFRVMAKLGFEKTLADFSFVEFGLIGSARQVPDSTTMEYSSIGAEGSYFGFLPIGAADISLHYEFKNYNRADNQDDHHRFDLYLNNRIGLGSSWFVRQKVDFEAVAYSNGDWVNSDYSRVGGAALAGLEIDGLTVAAGPEMEYLNQQQLSGDDLLFDTEDYFEAGFQIDLDYFSTGGIFASVEAATGRRNLQFENDYQTSFWYQRVYLIGDTRVMSSLTLSVLFSAEWEWHEFKQDNSELYLLSSLLSYSF